MRPNPQFPADLATFTEEKINGKTFLCGVCFFFFLKKKTKLLVKEIVTTFQTNVSAPYSLKISDIFNHI